MLTLVKAELRRLMNDVKEGLIAPNKASVCAQVGGVWCRVAELERRVRSDEELEERIAELERLAEQRSRPRWGRGPR